MQLRVLADDSPGRVHALPGLAIDGLFIDRRRYAARHIQKRNNRLG